MSGTLHTLGKKQSFKDIFLEYSNAVQCNNMFKMQAISQEEPLISGAYSKLGTDKVKKLRYTKKAIIDALNNLRNDMAIEQKIARQIQNNIPIGEVITCRKANQIIERAFLDNGIQHKAKATELCKWFSCSNSKTKRIDGTVTKVVEIYAHKMIYKDNGENILDNKFDQQ
jgi:hypothetical protein